ncbi:hypothetical protein KCP71_11915 [Salmonella enterica subsp. enterica]|nr:hypothetical protein KCP71_11915 [Salmonella enterica subsp. enterica]
MLGIYAGAARRRLYHHRASQKGLPAPGLSPGQALAARWASRNGGAGRQLAGRVLPETPSVRRGAFIVATLVRLIRGSGTLAMITASISRQITARIRHQYVACRWGRSDGDNGKLLQRRLF